MSDPQATPEPAPVDPFQQMVEDALIATRAASAQMLAQSKQMADNLLANMQQQQVNLESQTKQLMESFHTGRFYVSSPPPVTTATGESGQPPAANKPAAPAGPT